MRKLLLLSAALALAAPALAQPPMHGPGPHGRLFLSPSGEPFRSPNGLSAWFAQADADHDGRLTAAEFQADAWRAFAHFDTDHDGVLNGLEIQAYEREDAPEITEIAFEGGPPERGGHGFGGRKRGPGPDGGAGGGFQAAGGSGAARFSLLDEPQPLLAADEDVDGKVRRGEWERATARRFARLDRAHAGALTLDALRAAPAKR